MDTNEVESIFDGINAPDAIRRKYMLPKWIRFFSWVFAILGTGGGLIVIVALIFSLNFESSIYGFSAAGGVMAIAILVAVVYLLKGLTAIGLITEKDWAVDLAIADGIIGIVLCVYAMLTMPWVTHTAAGNYTRSELHLRLELLFLIPYLVKMLKIRADWKANKFVLRQTTERTM